MAQQCAAPTCPVPTETTICRACTADLEHLLEALLYRVKVDTDPATGGRRERRLPGLAEELATTLSRQCVHGGAGGRGSAEKPLAYDVRASDAYVSLRGALVACVRAVTGRQPRNDVGAMARWLLRHTNDVAAHRDGGKLLTDLRTANDRVERAIAGPMPRIPLGVCGASRQQMTACPAELTIRSIDQPYAKCRDCRHEHDVSQRIDRVRAEASGMLLPIRDIARLAAFLGEADNTARTERLINVWATRGRIARAGTSQSGRALYRAGEAFERLRAATGKAAS